MHDAPWLQLLFFRGTGSGYWNTSSNAGEIVSDLNSGIEFCQCRVSSRRLLILIQLEPCVIQRIVLNVISFFSLCSNILIVSPSMCSSRACNASAAGDESEGSSDICACITFLVDEYCRRSNFSRTSLGLVHKINTRCSKSINYGTYFTEFIHACLNILANTCFVTV